MEDESELFAFLTFFKICRMYQTLKAHKNKHKRLKIEERPKELPRGTKRLSNVKVSKRHFSMFSQTKKETNSDKSKSKCKSLKTSHESPLPVKNDLELLNNSESIPLEYEINNDTILSDLRDDVELSKYTNLQNGQSPEENKTILNISENYENSIINEIFNQIDDTNYNFTADEKTDHEDQNINVFDISIEENDEEPSSQPIVAEKKKRRRRRYRRPGDPPLKRLPPLNKIKKKKTRKFKIRPENRDRAWTNYYHTVFRKIKEKDEDRFIQLVRMTPKTFDALVKQLLAPLLVNKQIVMPKERLAVTLIYLAHGIHFDHLSEKFKLGRTTIRQIILRTCKVLWDILSPIYMKEPTSEDYLYIAEEFKTQCNLPNCVGILGTRRLPFRTNRLVKIAGKSYKCNEVKDVVAMASCDANYQFRQIGITVELHQFQFYKNIISNTLPLPPGNPLDEESSDIDFPYYFIGPEEFPQKINLMRPYNDYYILEAKQKMYNYSTACGQDINETAFNILTTTWRSLVTNGAFSIENWDIIVKACFLLHNFILVNDKQRWYQSDGDIKSSWRENMEVDSPTEWIDEKYPIEYLMELETVEAMDNGESSGTGLEAREVLTDYFCIEKNK